MVKGTDDEQQATDVAIKLTRDVLNVEGVSPLEKAVWLAMAFTASHEDGSGCYPKMATLARQLGYCERAIRGGIKRLERRGRLVKTKPSRNHAPAEWRVLVPATAGSVVRVERRSGLRVERRSNQGGPRSGLRSKTDQRQKILKQLVATQLKLLRSSQTRIPAVSIPNPRTELSLLSLLRRSG